MGPKGALYLAYRIGGLIEAPGLAGSLTLNGAEPRGKEPDVSPVPSPRVPEEKTPGPESPPGTVPRPGASGPRRPLRYGLSIEFEDRTDSDAMGRLAESTVWINGAHPAYRRAVASRSEGYHIALAAALALASVAVAAPPRESASLPERLLRALGRGALGGKEARPEEEGSRSGDQRPRSPRVIGNLLEAQMKGSGRFRRSRTTSGKCRPAGS